MELTKFSPRAKSKNMRHCSVPGCTSKANKDLDVIFHAFPPASKRFVNEENYFGKLEKVDVLQVWKKRLQIKNITPHMTVCSLHFLRDDYILPDVPSKKRYLKRIAVPSVNLPPTKKNIELQRSRRARLIKRNDKKQTNIEPKVNKDTELSELISNDIQEDDPVEVNDEKNIVENLQELPNTSMKRDVEVQVETDFFRSQFICLLTSDAVVNTLTGIETLENLNDIVCLVSENFGDVLQHPNAKTCIRERVVLTYLKLKQNLSYSCLAALFQSYTPRHCQRIVHDMIKMLSECFKIFIEWPSKDVISRNLPKSFRDLEDVRVVLDCIEINTQHSNNLCSQPINSTNNKKSKTIKFMIGVTPAGVLSFISRGYSGQVSDKAIFENSNITKLLEPGDGIIVDRAFRIEDICLKNGWTCYKPPCLRDKSQSPKAEAVSASKIAKARVNVERFNQRIRLFKVVGEKMSRSLVPLVDDIIRVVCATVNSNSPIVKDDDFIEA